jgi:hypothetical protein
VHPGRGEVEDRIPRELTAADAEEYRIRMTDPALGAPSGSHPDGRCIVTGMLLRACTGLKLAEHGLIHKHLNSFTGSECTDW